MTKLIQFGRWFSDGYLVVGTAQQRSLTGFSGTILGILFFWASVCFVPGVTHLLGVGARDATIVAATSAMAILGATLTYHKQGVTRFYHNVAFAEGCIAAAGYSYLIYASDARNSLLWLFYVYHTGLNAAMGPARRNTFLAVVVPLGLAVAFLVSGAPAAAALSLLNGLFAITLYLLLTRVYRVLSAALAREAELKLQLAELRVHQERSRIAEDLHDGIGANLAGLMWRVRAMTSSPRAAANTGELVMIEQRISEMLGSLRGAIWNLRRSPEPWSEIEKLLRERCGELCGDVSLVVEVSGNDPEPPPNEAYSELLRAAQELVRNAACHSGARSVEVRATLTADEVRLHVSDNGRGLKDPACTNGHGGLGSLRRRVESLGGRVEIESSVHGTTARTSIPI